MKLYFGKFKGRELSSVPRGYIRWLLSTDIDTGLRRACLLALDGIDVEAGDIEAEIMSLTCDETVLSNKDK